MTIPKVDSIGSLNALLGLFSGTQQETTTSPTTTTTRSNVTQDQLNALIAQEMAPLAGASHAAGMSAYGDTSLALGRGEVAGNLLAKYAGQTTTSSGDTKTTKVPGAFSPERIGSTVGSMATMQLGFPLLKKLSDKASEASTGMLDSLLGGGASNSPALGVLQNLEQGVNLPTGAAGSVASSIGDAVTGAVTSSGAGDLGSSLWDTISSGLSDVGDWLHLADGGLVDSTAPTDDIKKTGGSTGSSGGAKQINQEVGTISAPNQNAGTPVDVGGVLGSIGMSMLTVANPVLGMIASHISGIPTAQQSLLASVLGNAMGGTQAAEPGTAQAADNNPTAVLDTLNQTISNGTDPSSMSMDDMAGTIGGGDATESSSVMATGGKVSGAGTGTSDSIPAKLSDGEYVIDAKTVAALGPDFFRAIQAKFNPQAVANQKA